MDPCPVVFTNLVVYVQKPEELQPQAWWPGGRTIASPLRARPAATAASTSTTVPAAMRVARAVPGHA